MSFPRYANYKDSGVEWLGEVPSHWHRLPLKRCIRFTTGWTPPTGRDDLYSGNNPWATIADMDGRILSHTAKCVSDEAIRLAGTVASPRGSLLFSFKLSIGQVAFAGEGIYTNEAIATFLSGDKIDLDFAYYSFPLFVSANAAENIYGAKLLNQELIRSAILLLPPPREQRAIADFLDRETAKIDALVEAQRRLIALLKEKRQAVISHAVTKGLDPSAPLKPSGIPWLGDVPAHWEVTRLKNVALFMSGKAHEPFLDEDGDYIYVSARYVSTQGESDKRCSENLMPAKQDDILMVMSDLPNGRALARAFYVPDDKSYAVNQRVCAIRTKDVDSRYMFFQLNRSSGLLMNDDGVNQTHLSNSDFRDLPVLVPPSQEQSEIATRLLDVVSECDSLSMVAESAMVLLNERRAALISAAVTGKIDVRGWTAEQVRDAVGAEIVHFHARDRTFGRVQNQKLLFLAQTHAHVAEIGGKFERKAAGPHDAKLIVSIEQALTHEGVIRVAQPSGPGSQVSYTVTRGTRPDRSRLRAMLGAERLAKLDHLLTVLSELDTHGVEAVATLFGVWNDALLDGEPTDNDRLVRGFLKEWHPKKAENFTAAEVRIWIGFMRRNDLIPMGRGLHTQVGALL